MRQQQCLPLAIGRDVSKASGVGLHDAGERGGSCVAVFARPAEFVSLPRRRAIQTQQDLVLAGADQAADAKDCATMQSDVRAAGIGSAEVAGLEDDAVA